MSTNDYTTERWKGPKNMLGPRQKEILWKHVEANCVIPPNQKYAIWLHGLDDDLCAEQLKLQIPNINKWHVQKARHRFGLLLHRPGQEEGERTEAESIAILESRVARLEEQGQGYRREIRDRVAEIEKLQKDLKWLVNDDLLKRVQKVELISKGDDKAYVSQFRNIMELEKAHNELLKRLTKMEEVIVKHVLQIKIE